ncbi:MAG: tRNA uracil 4-sulfurtransferase ThiI [Candidatus Bathyarchaeia archaeon]|nr:tRNA uracil 4-sulfurtransferase ThiI [Candidatus Bathyarchaeia archaeon]MDI6904384.1 tRNA uracil 4-sulfurtransferase ThiI [Candidatus Bathyarchaeia archaeon]
MKFDSVIVRFGGEIGIKGEWTRRAYEKLLAKNIKKTLKHHSVLYEKLIHKRGRIYIKTKNVEETACKLTCIFGVSSVSPAIETTSDLNEIVQKTVELADAILENGSSFAVRCHRVGKHPYSSMDVCKEIGKQILAQLKNRKLRVDLKNPQFTVNVEVRDEYAYVFAETLQGVGGFPLGSQPKAICLLSGGIDSAVACWLAMKRGCPIIPVYFDITPFTDEATNAKALDVARKLFEWSIGFPRKVYIVPHGRNLETFVRGSPRKLTCILCKRVMYRVAERIAETEKAEGIITGEAIGEQASQTLHNLRVLNEAATKYPVLRPLLGFNKLETEELAKKIGTFEISTRKTEGCIAAPKKPATKARLEIVKKAEQELDIEGMIEESVREAKIVTV